MIPADIVIEKMADALCREIHGHGISGITAPEVKEDMLKRARVIWDAGMGDMQSLSPWMLGTVAISEEVDKVFVLLNSGGGILVDSDGETMDLLAHSVKINYRKDGSVSHFQVSKIGVE